MQIGKLFIGLILTMPLYAQDWILNNPYPARESQEKIYYTSFGEQPKTLDPARSYSSNEYQIISQIYEPLLQYDYFLRPYTLIPLLAKMMPTVVALDSQQQLIKLEEKETPSYTLYTLEIKPGIYYQPHPALAKNQKGEYRYLNLAEDYLDRHHINRLSDFKYMGSREVIADDFIYQIKRLANPKVGSPIFGLMSEHIVGFKEYADKLNSLETGNQYIDLRNFPLNGVKKIDQYRFQILLKGQYPQFKFWLAMPFFSPIPWEADRFYAQPDMDDRNLSLDWYPIGTGSFLLAENNPNRKMILKKNPFFRLEYFPENGDATDKLLGYTALAGQRVPLIDQASFILEKESIPRWNKFLQGYYDISGISSESFAQAITISPQGEPQLTPQMQGQNLRLTKTIDTSTFYLGFNMLDPVVGGSSERARLLRQAISIAINYDENIAIFLNGRGKPAQGPLPPGIFGYQEGEQGINPYVYRWQNNMLTRRPLGEAKDLLRQAGYLNGQDPQTGRALILNYDIPVTGSPDDQAQLEWMRKQFAKLGIDLNIRATQYNRFQEKMRHGNAQIFSWGWNADYPDPENFLFLLYGPNGKVNYGGENAANYANPLYDQLFEAMRNRPDDAKRLALINQMVALVRKDAPWVWGINMETLLLSQQWVSPLKPNTMRLNTLKYLAIDLKKRNQMRALWNKPILWPLGVLFILFMIGLLPVFFSYWQKEKSSAMRKPFSTR